MKTIKIQIIIALTLFIQLTSCLDLNEVNVSPNNPENVSSNFILTYVLTGTAKSYVALGDVGSDVSGAMQYNQNGTNQGAGSINQFAWTRSSWGAQYDYLRNIKIIHDKSLVDKNKLFEAISLVLRAFNYGIITDLFGDIPYSESMSAADGIYFSKYDDQKSVYKGILQDLKDADAILADPGIAASKIDPNADLLFKGSSDGWRKFANSLRMRYAMRLINKKADMTALGVDLIYEFNAASAFTFTANADEAFVSYLGVAGSNSAPGGLLNTANPNFLTKPCKTIVDTLKSRRDPRLERWVLPVNQKWDATVLVNTPKTYTNLFGEAQPVIYYPTANFALDTALYVGLPQNLAVINLVGYNQGTAPVTLNPEKSPWISFLHSRYRQNKETYIRMDLMCYSEVEFLLSEAAQRGGFSASDPETHYKNGILASMKRWGIADGTGGFSFTNYYNSPKVSLASASNKLERIIGQKWVSLWLNVESWFDYRRTGYPVLLTGPVTQYGPALPLRFMYPEPGLDPKYLVNYNEAVAKLEVTSYVPSGQSKDHTYSKMWLVQGTGLPY